MNYILSVVLLTLPLGTLGMPHQEVGQSQPIENNVDTAVHIASKQKETDAPQVPGWSTNICVNLCPKWCHLPSDNSTDYTNCNYVCGNICNDQTRDTNPFLGNETYEVVPSPFLFSSYDQDGDKRLSVQEVARTENVPQEDVMKLFQFADFNEDGYIDTDEFQGAPFVFTVQLAAEMTAVVKPPPAQTPTDSI